MYIKSSQTFAVLAVLMASVCLCRGGTVADSWITVARESRTIFKSCPMDDFYPYNIWLCIKKGSLELYDKIMTADVIPITDQIRLVRYRGNKPQSQNTSQPLDTNQFLYKQSQQQNLSNVGYGPYPEIDRSIWLSHIGARSLDMFSTHAIQIDLKRKLDEGRARHRRNQLLPIMVFGMTAIGMIMVPIGFQLLAVLGGKALLLSKLALLLASINGLRRVAANGFHYGLYHADPHYNHGVWERSENSHIYTRPRSQY